MISKLSIPLNKMQKIEKFLKENPNKMFKATEIAELVFKDIKETNYINAILNRFEWQGKVVHLRPYWGWNANWRKK